MVNTATNSTPIKKPNKPNSLSDTAHGNRKAVSKIKQNEQNRHQVIANVKLHSGIFKCLEAAFVRGVFGSIRPIGPEDVAEDLWNDADTDADQDEQEYRKILIEVHL